MNRFKAIVAVAVVSCLSDPKCSDRAFAGDCSEYSAGPHGDHRPEAQR